MANNAIITWDTITDLATKINNVYAQINSKNAVYQRVNDNLDRKAKNTSGVSAQLKGIVSKNIQDLTFVTAQISISLTANNYKYQPLYFGDLSSPALSNSGLSGDVNSIVVGSAAISPADAKTYSVTFMPSTLGIAALSDNNKILGVVRCDTKPTKTLPVTVHLLYIGFPPA